MDPRTAVRARLLMGVGLGLLTSMADLTFALGDIAGPTLVTAALHVGVAALAVYGVAYRAMERLLGGGRGRAVAWAGMLAGSVGAATHAVTGVVILDRLAQVPDLSIMGAPLPHLPTVLVPLWALLGVVVVSGSVVFTAAVLRGGTLLPRWAGLGSPALISLAAWGAGALTPWSDTIGAIAPNLGHLGFFALVLAVYRHPAGEGDGAREG